MLNQPTGSMGVVGSLLIVACAILAPVLSPYDPTRACTQRLPREPEDSHDNHPGGAERHAPLVIAGGQGAELFAASEEVLDQMATAVGGAIEGAGVIFGAELGDGLADAASSEGSAVAAAGVAFVTRDAARPHPRPATSRSSDRALVHERLEDGRFVLLPRSEQDGQRLAVPLGLEVHLGREAALAAPQRLGCWAPPFAPAAC